MKKKELAAYRERVKYVFQDPARSLNPRMTVYGVLTSGYRWSSRWISAKAARNAAGAILAEVGLSAGDLDRRPADFSGGQRQRISIARALLLEPELLICDEVVSALDVSIQGQILNLLLDLRERRGLSMLFIAHDLKVASYFCDRIGVMYKGELMEESPARDFYRTCRHPYTQLLFSCVADKEKRSETNRTVRQDTVSEAAGCPFAPRCPIADERCFTEHPEFRQLVDGHKIRCFKA